MAEDGGGYWRTCAEVTDGKVVRRPASMAAHKVERVGEHMVA